MQQKELDEYWDVFNTKVKHLSELDQRKVAYEFSLLVKGNLDELGLEALRIIEQLTYKKVALRTCERIQKRLQEKLPGNNTVSPYSVLIWTLQPNTASYPVWYSTGIAGLNLPDLHIATLPELTKLIERTLEALKTKSA
ncbi:MAG: hypothetical protein EOO46_17145 [Flavobacterium sp.]|nr:MAG: hypothetical protein EOO46_17145 [Flavobacterium sp.]